MTNSVDVRTTADQIIRLECDALDRWGNGDPAGFLELYAPDVSYFDPLTDSRIDGHGAMAEYYRPWAGAIRIDRYEMLNPQVVVDENMALLTYNLVNYTRDASGLESVGSRWNSTVAYQRHEGAWNSFHSHWSFTRHSAFQNLTVETSEELEG